MVLLGGMCKSKNVFDHCHCTMVGYNYYYYNYTLAKPQDLVCASVRVFTVYRTYAFDRFKEDLVTEMLNVLWTGEMTGNNEGIPQVLGNI